MTIAIYKTCRGWKVENTGNLTHPLVPDDVLYVLHGQGDDVYALVVRNGAPALTGSGTYIGSDDKIQLEMNGRWIVLEYVTHLLKISVYDTQPVPGVIVEEGGTALGPGGH